MNRRNEQMKPFKYLIVLLLVLMTVLSAFSFAGCSSTADDPEIQAEFLSMLEGTATPESLLAASDYLDSNLKKVEEEIRDQMLLSYEGYLMEYVNNDVDFTKIDLIAPYYDFASGTIDATKITDQKLAAMLEMLVKSGIKMASSEGMVYPIIDYTALADKYEKQMSTALLGLYRLKAVESDSTMSEDAGLVISWAELAERAYAVEQYIKEYKSVELIKEEAAWIYQNYINTMLMGMNNTPAFDYETGAFNQDAAVAYQEFIQKHPGSTTTWVLEEFYSYLDSIEFTMDYNDENESKSFFDTCAWLVSEAGKRVFE